MNLLSELNMLNLSIVAPLLGAFLIAVTGSYPNLRDGINLAVGILVLGLLVNLYHVIGEDVLVRSVWTEILPGLTLSFTIDPFGLYFSLIAGSLWIITTLYAIGYMRSHHEENQTRFYACFSIAIGATMAIAFSDNLFTLFVFYELLTLTTYPLVTHARTDKARKNGRIYLGILLVTSILFLLPAIIATWLVTGTLEFGQDGIFSRDTPAVVTGTLLLLYVLGVGKAAIIPFHGWLPAAMVAPTPVSALLHAVAVVKAGVFTIMKVCMYIFGPDLLHELGVTQVLLYLAAATILFASIMALRQDNLKMRLAYSTVGQLSYITIGALLATSSALAGGVMHIAMHAFGKITLFFCAGVILVMTHKTEISQMRGIGKEMPLTMIAFFIASLSIIGIPPTGGMWSKWYLITGTYQAEQWLITVTLLLSTLLTITYLIPISVRAFFPAGNGNRFLINLNEGPRSSMFALLFTAAGCIVLFIFAQPLHRLVMESLPK